MSNNRVIRVKNSSEYFQKWKESRNASLEAGGKPNAEDYKADPDLMAAPENTDSEELAAAKEALYAGARQALTALQQKIFEQSVVYGVNNIQLAKELGISPMAVRKHLKAIGKKLLHETRRFL